MKILLTQIRFLYRARDQFGKKVGIVDGEPYWKGHAKRVH